MLQKSYIGMDISPYGIKMVELTGFNLLSAQVSRVAQEKLPLDTVIDLDDVDSVEFISDVIKTMYRKHGFKGKDVAVSLPPNRAITKKIVLPVMANEKIMEFAEKEISDALPDSLSIGDVSIEYKVLSVDNKEDEMVVLLFAARDEEINSFMTMIESADLNPLIVDIESNAIKNGLQLMCGSEFKSSTVAYIELGWGVARLLVFKDGEIQFMRDGEVLGQDLNSLLMQELSITYEKSEEIRLSRNRSPTHDLLIRGFYNKYLDDIVDLFTLFKKQQGHFIGSIDSVVLVGDLADTPGLIYELKNEMLSDSVPLSHSYAIGDILTKAKVNHKKSQELVMSHRAGLFLSGVMAYRSFLRGF